ncbi:DUF2227 family putative metal-binding protein [Deinococcus multiflagellatus]|uniref:DUF2227 family putative metal-binding protein n=1 Tax=Deinococcus multiflagellatus TaxID=1656887 RepID=UPI001CCF5962|nr:DUF2227 family putative metal-binding protein [Deinococcus multiflagellatus]MBZ9715779.1 DUF2227 family putative metal-binding protein [Deinococcus multiflagellatus]
MPSGRIHTLINGAATAGAAAVAWLMGLPLTSPEALALISGAFCGTVLITPDLDMAHVRVDARRAWGPLGWVWWPLLSISKHRGVSHTWVRGPLIRLTYIVVVLGLMLLLVKALWEAAGWPWPPLRVPEDLRRPAVLAAAGFGYWAAQALHLAADRIPLTWRRL